jgi:transcription antitermination factor NusG
MHRQPVLNQPVNHLHDTEAKWFAVNTRSKSEKYVQRLLEKKGVTAWVPLQRLMRRYTRSTRMVEKPLLNCYVFVHIVKEQYVRVLETEHVSGFVRFSKNLISIPQAEIDLIKRITLEDGLDIEAVQGQLEEGDAVEISAGNLIGLKGRIVQVQGKRKFQVELSHIGYSLLITIDAAFLHRFPGKLS